jgi:hypothetical protein
MSRDLDSALTQRERDAVNVWLASNKSFHSMRDHPMHGVPMLGGMWGFRPPLDPKTSHLLHNKIHDRELLKILVVVLIKGFFLLTFGQLLKRMLLHMIVFFVQMVLDINQHHFQHKEYQLIKQIVL